MGNKDGSLPAVAALEQKPKRVYTTRAKKTRHYATGTHWTQKPENKALVREIHAKSVKARLANKEQKSRTERVLEALAQIKEPVPAPVLARSLGLPQRGMSAVLGPLEKKGKVVREKASSGLDLWRVA